MTPKSAAQFAAWLSVWEPQIFAALKRQARAKSTLGRVHLGNMPRRSRRGVSGLGCCVFTSGAYCASGNYCFSGSEYNSYCGLEEITPTTGACLNCLEENELQTVTPTTGLCLSQYGGAAIQPVCVNLACVSSCLQLATSCIPQFSISCDGTVTSSSPSVTGSLTKAIGDVGSYLTSAKGLSTLASLASSYFAVKGTQAEAQVVSAQAALAQSGRAPAPVGYAYNSAGQLVPVTTDANGAIVPVASGGAIASSGFSPLVLMAGVALVFLFLIKR